MDSLDRLNLNVDCDVEGQLVATNDHGLLLVDLHRLLFLNVLLDLHVDVQRKIDFDVLTDFLLWFG